MLITSRMEGEDMIIIVPPSDKPTVIVHRTLDVRRNGTVRQGYDAPREVTINRREVQERINRELAAPAAV